MTQFEIKENEKFFSKVINMLKEGGIYMMPATSEIYILKNKKLECSNSGYKNVSQIVSKTFLENNFIKSN